MEIKTFSQFFSYLLFFLHKWCSKYEIRTDLPCSSNQHPYEGGESLGSLIFQNLKTKVCVGFCGQVFASVYIYTLVPQVGQVVEPSLFRGALSCNHFLCNKIQRPEEVLRKFYVKMVYFFGLHYFL